ncbi:MAG: NmrA family NAD(P)-binding protein [Balneolales bacterium]
MYVITGATGKTGRIISNILLNQGNNIRVIARNEKRLWDFEEHGAEIMPGNLLDKDFVVRAFKRAKIAYIMIPTDPVSGDIYQLQKTLVDNYIEAILQSDITHVVTLSSVGAHLPDRVGIVQGLYYMEQRLNQIEQLNLLHVRATYFMENLFRTIDMVKSAGKIMMSFNPRLKFPITAKRDVAKVIVQHLLDLDFDGKFVRYVLGERDLSFNEVADVLGKAIGNRDLIYSQIMYENARSALVRSGMSESVADAQVDFIRAVNEGRVFERVKRTSDNTTPISIEEFSRQYALIYESRDPVIF